MPEAPLNRGGSRLLLGLSMLSFLACQPGTTVGGYSCFPDGADRGAAEYCLWVHAVGAPGKAYVDRSKKLVNVTIRSGSEEVLLEREYTAVAGDLRWHVRWEEPADLEVLFYEYDDPVPGAQSGHALSRVPRQVLGLAFTHVAPTGAFIEAPAPVAVIEEAADYDALENRRHIVSISFADTREHEKAILEVVTSLAAAHDLIGRAPVPGLIGRIAEWTKDEFSLDVHRHDSLAEIAVTLEDYGDRELSGSIAKELAGLPGVGSTRRFVSINMRTGPAGAEPARKAVAAAAQAFNLQETEPSEMFSLAGYERAGLTVLLSFFEQDGKLKVSVEDTGWTTEFYDLEAALRSALGTEESGEGI